MYLFNIHDVHRIYATILSSLLCRCFVLSCRLSNLIIHRCVLPASAAAAHGRSPPTFCPSFNTANRSRQFIPPLHAAFKDAPAYGAGSVPIQAGRPSPSFVPPFSTNTSGCPEPLASPRPLAPFFFPLCSTLSEVWIRLLWIIDRRFHGLDPQKINLFTFSKSKSFLDSLHS